MEALWLVHNGVPFDLAFQLEPTVRTAFCIVFSQFGGREWDWDAMRFKPPREAG